MIDLLAAAQIASIVGNAVSTLDKVYERFVTYKTKRPANEVVHPPSIVFGNEPGNEQFACRTVGNGGGAICQVVKYEELKNELKTEDLSYVSAIDRKPAHIREAMEQYLYRNSNGVRIKQSPIRFSTGIGVRTDGGRACAPS